MIEQKLAALGLTLPPTPAAAAAYLGYKVSGNWVIVSGQLPLDSGKPTMTGKLKPDDDISPAIEAARQCALNVLAQLDASIAGDWTRFVQVVRLGGFVACSPDFVDAPKVINGASELMVQLFGDAGKHARAAVGVASLPMDVTVEVEAIFEIRA